MLKTIRQIRNLAHPNYFRRALANPRDIPQGFRVLRRAYRKDRLDYEQERMERPSRLSNLLGNNEEELISYESEISDNEHILEHQHRRSQLVESNIEGGTSSDIDCTTLYLVTRALQPESVVETGVLYGAFDAYVTAAMEENGRGSLTSLDLPGQPSEEYDYGYLIPTGCRDRWDLRLGDATQVLEDLLKEVGPVDMFIHDSSHYPEHMRFEYETAYPHIRKGGILASHDILLADTFSNFCEEYGLEYETIANTGIAIKK